MIEIYKSVGRKKRWFESKSQMKKFWDGSGCKDSKYYDVKVFKLEWTKNGNVWKEIDPEKE